MDRRCRVVVQFRKSATGQIGIAPVPPPPYANPLVEVLGSRCRKRKWMSLCSARASSGCRRPMPRGSAGMSVVLVDRREPGSETSYGNAGIISSGSISPLNNPSLWKALPKYLTNRHPALRWNPVWAASERGMGRALSGQFGRLASQAAGGRLARADRRIAETASGMDRESGRRASHPRDRLAEGVARRCRCRGEAGAGPADRIRHRQRIARPPGASPRIEPGIVPVYKVGLLHTPDRLGRLAGRGGQGLCADVRGRGRRSQAVGRQVDRA